MTDTATTRKKLIEVSIPLQAINKEALPQAKSTEGLPNRNSQVLGSAANRSLPGGLVFTVRR
jgi:hypothetical protein